MAPNLPVDALLLSVGCLPDPFFCLLEDDRLITKVSVETDSLLEAIKGDPNDVRVTITVRIRPYQMHVGNMMLG
jgi:hypothetical protein